MTALMTETRKAKVEHLHSQISQDGYSIDPDAIAEAILRRLLGGYAPSCDPADDDTI